MGSFDLFLVCLIVGLIAFIVFITTRGKGKRRIREIIIRFNEEEED